jgi:periplasmic protein TonB
MNQKKKFVQVSSKLDNMHHQARRKALSCSFQEEFLDTDRLRQLSYGNLVLRRQAHLFLSYGVLTAIVLLGLFWLVTANWQTLASLTGLFKKDQPMVECYEVVTSVTQLPPPPPLDLPEPVPVTPSSPAVVAPPNVGRIKQVSQEEAPVQQTLATQKELKQAIQTGTGNGSGGVSSGDEVPMFIPCEKMPGFLDQKMPIYPEMARIAGITGKVFVSVLIAEDGRPIKAKVMKRIPADCEVFDAVALKSVMESRYYPGIQNGSPIKVWFTVPIRFQLD